MKPYGLARRMQYELGVRTEVTTEGPDDSAEANQIRISSSLDAKQLRQLHELVEQNGWELIYRGGWFLAAVPEEPNFEDAPGDVPDLPDV